MDDTRQLIVLNNNDNRDQQTKLSTTVPTKSRITNNDISKQISSDTELKILTQNEYIQLNKRKLTKYTIQYKNHTLHEPKRGYVQYKKNYLNKNSTDNIIPSLNS